MSTRTASIWSQLLRLFPPHRADLDRYSTRMGLGQGLTSALTNFSARKRLLGSREEYRALAPVCCESSSLTLGGGPKEYIEEEECCSSRLAQAWQLKRRAGAVSTVHTPCFFARSWTPSSKGGGEAQHPTSSRSLC